MNSEDWLRYGLKTGDTIRFKDLFLEYYPRLTRYSAQITQDPEASRELVQDLFLEIWELRNTLNIKGSLKNYLFVSAYHKSLNFLRSRRLRDHYRENPVEIHQWFRPDSTNEQADPLFLGEVEKEIKLLPERCREIFILCAIEGFPIAEAAIKTGISLKTAENHLGRARKILRTRLKNLK